jgi:hypothetical protein
VPGASQDVEPGSGVGALIDPVEEASCIPVEGNRAAETASSSVIPDLSTASLEKSQVAPDQAVALGAELDPESRPFGQVRGRLRFARRMEQADGEA